jgi:hypothetical protein
VSRAQVELELGEVSTVKSPMARIGLVFGVLAVATLGLIMYQIVAKQQAVSCEVCITFEGRRDCREAAGPDRNEAIRTATSNACALISSGMAGSISCGSTRPDSVQCSDD